MYELKKTTKAVITKYLRRYFIKCLYHDEINLE